MLPSALGVLQRHTLRDGSLIKAYEQLKAMNVTTGDSAETNELLRRAQAGRSQALEQLFDRHMPSVRESVRRRLAPRLRPRVDPSDVIQETQHAAYRRLDDFLQRRPLPFKLWLLKTAHERLIDIERAHLAAQRTVHRESHRQRARDCEMALST